MTKRESTSKGAAALLKVVGAGERERVNWRYITPGTASIYSNTYDPIK